MLTPSFFFLNQDFPMSVSFKNFFDSSFIELDLFPSNTFQEELIGILFPNSPISVILKGQIV